MNKLLKFALFLFLFFFMGCGTTSKGPNKKSNAKLDQDLSSTNLEKIEVIDEMKEPMMAQETTPVGDVAAQKLIEKIDYPKDSKDHIQNFSLKYFKGHFDSWVNYLGNKDRERFLRHLENGRKFFPTISKILKENGMPQELFLVGLIESGYYTRARSHAAAVGPWQFIKGTATRYGLKVSRAQDDRSDLEKSTLAAAHYFKDLYNIFGNWELALCAYNAGEYRIINAIRKGNTRDYPTLVKKGLLPPETVMYIPKIEAARELIRNNKKYNLPYLTDAFSESRSPADSDLVAAQEDATQDDSVMANKNDRRSFSVVKAKRKTRREEKRPVMVTKIKKGDKLSKIAEAYGIDVNQLSKINNIKTKKILAGQNLKIPVAKKSYTVRPGDNLNDIAKKYGVTVAAILRHNQLDSRRIFPKQKLIVPVAYGEL